MINSIDECIAVPFTTPPAVSGAVALHAAYPSSDTPVGTTADLAVTLPSDTKAVGAVELTLTLPAGWQFVSAVGGDRLTKATVLTSTEGRGVRVAAFAKDDGTTGGGL